MIALYALPGDDVCQQAAGLTVTLSAEDTDYPAENIFHPNPAKPAKWTSVSGTALFDFGTAVNIYAVALIYTNLDPSAVSVTVSWGNDAGASTGSVSMPLGATWDDGWTPNPWVIVPGSPTYRYWLITISGTNGTPLAVGRAMFLGALRSIGRNVRFGETEAEQHKVVEMDTELEVETIYELGGKRRSFDGEFGINDERADTFVSLMRSAKGRSQAWLLIPDQGVNDAWIVRFADPGYERKRTDPDFNALPFRVRELSRGLPWP